MAVILLFFSMNWGTKLDTKTEALGLALLTNGCFDSVLKKNKPRRDCPELSCTALATLERSLNPSWPQQLLTSWMKTTYCNTTKIFSCESSTGGTFGFLAELRVTPFAADRDLDIWIEASLKFILGLNPLTVNNKTSIHKPFWRI